MKAKREAAEQEELERALEASAAAAEEEERWRAMYRRHDGDEKADYDEDEDEDEDEDDHEDEEGDEEEDVDDEKDEDNASDERGGAKQGERNADGGCEELDVEAASRAFVLSALKVAGCPELADRFYDEAMDAEALMLSDREDLVELGVPPAKADRLLDFLNQGL